MAISLTFFLVIVFSGLILFIFTFALFIESKDSVGYQKIREVSPFYCVRCGKFYAVKGNVYRKPCPYCQFKNIKLSF